MDKKSSTFSRADVNRFLIPSLLGAVAFLLPIPVKGTLNTPLGLAIDWGKAVLKGQLPFMAMVLVCIGAAVTVWASLARPKAITERPFLRDLFIVTPFWNLSRLAGALLYIVIYYKMGPEVIWNMDNGGTPAMILAPALLIVFIVLAGAVPLLTDFGLMEYVGTMARPVMKPLFTLPGRAAVDCLASWVGSSSVGVVITTKVHDEGYYSDREAAIISTTFSVISVAYIYVMADFVGLPHKYFQILLSVYAVTFLLALVMPRLWPLKTIPDTYSGRAGRQAQEDLPEGYSLSEWALKTAVEKARREGLSTVLATCVKTFVSLVVSTMPLVVSWGTVVLLVANNTPLFQWISAPFAWMLALVHIPEAAQVAPAFVLSYADQFLAAVVGSAREAEAAKFMCAGISATGLIYMTEVGVLILNSSIPLGIGKLTFIYFVRAILSVFLLAPFALWLC
ncbi:YjiH family protein [Aminithiophilus ramosus]|uniref:YjiH family protein n=1 Tax=Aminithiophilus ramosus TaxID=3029084 RepID=A0A9Q7AHF1_9BACT|nr:YjiH family protein [Aminithiophilus ramosus]QTX31970.1 YjiH family protein [Aminithiophilus ramosus]